VTRGPKFTDQNPLVVLRDEMQIRSKRSPSRVVHSGIDVKAWAQRCPSVEQARPAHCPRCGCSSRPVGKPLALVGHGKRERQVRGPLAPGSTTSYSVILVRRYYCRNCKAVVTVVPQGVIGGRHFGAGAIASALYEWSIRRRSLNSIRERVGGRDVERRGWPAARRWVDAVEAGCLFSAHVRPCPPDSERRRIAERAVTTLIALGRPVANSDDVGVQLFTGAELAA
jgi:hypothetical protein